jgi:hypothetical protein
VIETLRSVIDDRHLEALALEFEFEQLSDLNFVVSEQDVRGPLFDSISIY